MKACTSITADSESSESRQTRLSCSVLLGLYIQCISYRTLCTIKIQDLLTDKSLNYHTDCDIPAEPQSVTKSF